MGYDIARFEGEIDEELLCPICSGVLEDPVQVSSVMQQQALLVTCLMITACSDWYVLDVDTFIYLICLFCDNVMVQIFLCCLHFKYTVCLAL